MVRSYISEIARAGSHMLDPRRRGIVVLRAYFDDSGTHAGSKAVVLAGFMGTSDEWDLFEPEWSAILKREGLKSFHAADFHSARGQCQDWGRARIDAVRADFRNVLAVSNVIGIGAVVRSDDWDAAASAAIRNRFHSPIYLAFEHCIQQALHWAQRATDQQTGVIEKVAFVFDSFNRDAAVCLDIGKHYEGGWFRSEWYESMIFAGMEQALPLQAADMLAHPTYRLETARVRDNAEPTLDAHFRAMLEQLPIHGQYYDQEALRKLDAQMGLREDSDLLMLPSWAAPSS